eukprot:TRINITY_DN80574_c0_g1_i1.p1 TRINITY_DN80574_c0_g1~~TRINITY_DN80574_c0_g1_i1.p1  ORF type:complete len:196 (+),score=55.73 TRINITY_DN80574_c0_g1_i1:25-588(+)
MAFVCSLSSMAMVQCLSALVMVLQVAQVAGLAVKEASAQATERNATRAAELQQQRVNLGGLLDHLKADISKFNKNEASDKQKNAARLEELRKKLDQDKAQLKDQSLSPFMREMLTNRTKNDEREIEYWSHGRDLQNRMFRSNIQATHGLMSKVKGVLQAYDEVINGGNLSVDTAKRIKALSGDAHLY